MERGNQVRQRQCRLGTGGGFWHGKKKKKRNTSKPVYSSCRSPGDWQNRVWSWSRGTTFTQGEESKRGGTRKRKKGEKIKSLT